MELDLQPQTAGGDIIDIITQINSDLLPFYKAAAEILHAGMIRQFETEGEYYLGHPWAELRPSTIAERKRKGFTPINILRRRSGDAGLMGSMTTAGKSDGIEMGVSSRVFYAPYLHFGTRHMSPRPILPFINNRLMLNEADYENLAEIYLTFISKVLGN